MPSLAQTNGRRTKRIAKCGSKYAELMGILPDPPELVRNVDEGLKDRPATTEARRHLIENLKLNYYFRGLHVIFIRRPKGRREIVGVEEEIPQRLAALSLQDRVRVVYSGTSPWFEETE